MSLKAKIEAVIYASEEPVTLAQLAGLLGQEAQAELDHLDSAQQTLALDSESNPESGPDSSPQQSPEPQEPSSELSEEAPADTYSEVSEERSGDSSAETPEAGSDAAQAASDSENEDSDPAKSEPAEAAAAPGEPELESSSPEEPSSPENAATDPTPDKQLASPEANSLEPVRPESKQDEKARERRLREYFRSILDELIADYANDSNDRGLEIREVAGGFRLATKPQYHDAVRGFVKSLKPPLKLSLQALETLAVVAYKQPVTAPEVSEIRGVDSGGVLGSLMARKLITTAGRKQVIGRPILYKTTRDFLLRFGLKDINELPSIEEFEKMAGELADAFAEPVQEEIPMPEHAAPESAEQLEPEANAVEPQADGDETPISAPAEDQPEGQPEEASEKSDAATAPETPTPAAETAADPGESNGLTEPIDESHSSSLRADQEQSSDSESAAEEAVIDGRLSGLPPVYEGEAGSLAVGSLEGPDTPARDAAIQSAETAERSEEGE